MVQRASSEAGHGPRLGINYGGYQSGYNKLFTQVIGQTLSLHCPGHLEFQDPLTLLFLTNTIFPN